MFVGLILLLNLNVVVCCCVCVIIGWLKALLLSSFSSLLGSSLKPISISSNKNGDEGGDSSDESDSEDEDDEEDLPTDRSIGSQIRSGGKLII